MSIYRRKCIYCGSEVTRIYEHQKLRCKNSSSYSDEERIKKNKQMLKNYYERKLIRYENKL